MVNGWTSQWLTKTLTTTVETFVLHIFWHNVFFYTFLFSWDPLLNWTAKFVFNVLHRFHISVGLSGGLLTICLVRPCSLLFVCLFVLVIFNSIFFPPRIVRTLGISLFWSWLGTLSHLFLPSAELKRCHSAWPLSNERKGCYHLEWIAGKISHKCGPTQWCVCLCVTLSSLGNE